MTDYPIPDELRDEFAAAWNHSWSIATETPRQVVTRTKRDLDAHVAHGAHIELRLPEFAVHDGTCCTQTIRLHVIDMRTSPTVECLSCDWAMTGATDAEAKAGARSHNDALEAEQRANRVPCPGVGYYHWTRSEDR